MKVLVIYDVIPEEQMRALVDMSQQEWDYFSKAHNEYINETLDKEVIDVINVIDSAFSTSPRELSKGKQAQYFGQWLDDTELTDISDVDKLLCCGILLQ